MLYATLFLSGLIVASVLRAQAQPTIHVVEGTSFEWGEVMPGIVQASLHVTNVGTDTLVIEQVQTSCGCTTAPIDKSRIVSGDTALLDVRIDMKDRSGDQLKDVILVSNDKVTPSLTIQFHATVQRDLVAEPSLFPSVMGLTKGREVSTSVEILNIGSETVALREPVMVAAGLRARFEITPSRELKPGARATLTAHLTPVSDGYLIGYVKVPSSSSSVPEVNVRIVMHAAETSAAASKP